MQDDFLLLHVWGDDPLFGFYLFALKKARVEGVELMDENFVDLCALPSGIEVLECFEDAPVIPK